jgi:hypothetical protein
MFVSLNVCTQIHKIGSAAHSDNLYRNALRFSDTV